MPFLDKELLGMTAKQLAINSIIAVVLIAVGVVIGKIASGILNRVLDKARIEKTKAYNFFKILVVVVKWSIYILFLSLAIKVLDIPQFTYWLSDIIVVIPALVGALLLIIIGFAIAVYLKNAVSESKIEYHETLSQIFFFFIIYVFMVFALKTALISIDTTTVNMLVVILTAIIGIAIALRAVKFKKK